MRQAVRENFSAATLRERAAFEDGTDVGRAHGDHILNPDIIERLSHETLRDAAVLVPVIDYGDRTQVLLTQRTAKMRTHSGQIAFPGGAVDGSDTSIESAALREAEEEIGLDPSFVEPVGRLPQYLTTTGFRITPVLAIVRSDYGMVINHDEVDDAFEVPFDFFDEPCKPHSQKPGMGRQGTTFLHHALRQTLYLGGDCRNIAYTL